MKIPNNSLIKVSGWVMLKKVEAGKTYRIKYQQIKNYPLIYRFHTPNGDEPIIGHYANDVDCWTNTKNLNRIEII